MKHEQWNRETRFHDIELYENEHGMVALLGVGTSSYLAVEEVRLNLLASKMNLARAFEIVWSELHLA